MLAAMADNASAATSTVPPELNRLHWLAVRSAGCPIFVAAGRPLRLAIILSAGGPKVITRAAATMR